MSGPSGLGAIAHYNLLERLEPSGPGDLFRARDTRLGRTVTVRWLPEGFSVPGLTQAQLIERARGLAALSHPNITTLFDAGVHEGRAFLVFEYLKGQSLRAEMAGRPVNVRRAIEVAIQITNAVADAHAAGYVHGGLSPDSIALTGKGHAKIPAFELASQGGFEPGDGGMRLRDYDSPEEARGEAADDRSDIYSIGAVLYEMLTARRPSHRGASAPSGSNPHVPPELDAVALKAIAPNPESRYQSAATFAAELRNVAAVLDLRSDLADEGHAPPASASVGKVVILAAAILAALALLTWWRLG